MKKVILVAGGAGFVGSHLCEYLVSLGHFVIALDNLSTGNKKNINPLLSKKNFQFIKGDVCKWNLSKIGKTVTEIYHLASPASPVHYQKNPISTWKANTVGTLNLLELGRLNNANFLFASTSEVYGDPKEHPQKESYWGNVNPVGVRSCYDESKRAGEALVMDYHRQFKIQTKIIRIFNTYGPRMDSLDGRVVSNFIVQALNNLPLTVYGKGAQTRSFQYIGDLVHGMVKTMDMKGFTGPVNLGNPKEFTMLELASIIIKITKSTSKIIFKSLPEDDPKQRKPNISLAKKKLNWQPYIKLEDGLLKTIGYFRNVL